MVQTGYSTTSLTRTAFYQNALGEMYAIVFGGLVAKGNKVSFVIYNSGVSSANQYQAYGYYENLVEL
jgi:hypothetical protein